MSTISDAPHDSRMPRKAVTAATIGTALEWFDFTLYGAMSATILPKLFFPAMEPTAGLLASLATFGVGLAARPLGAITCGYLGDKLGRRNLMLATVTMMGLASVLMGLLPTYGQVGIWAPILLVLLRIIQGFALGGESTGAQLMALEHASPDRRGRYSGMLGLCSPLSQILANGVLMGLAATLSSEQFESFGWRIPFLMSFVLVIVAIFIRLKVDETPAFVALKKAPLKQEKSPLTSAVSSHYKTILRLMLFFCSPAALFYLIVIFSLSYLTKHLGFSQSTGFMSLMVANLCAIFGALAGGYLSDRWGRKKALALGSCMTLLILFVYFPILNTLNVPAIMAIMGLFLGFTQFQSGIQPVAFAEAFPTQVRYSGSALAYTGANLVIGGPMPMIAVWLMSQSNNSPWPLVTLCAVINLISLAMIITGRETRGIDLNAVAEDDTVDARATTLLSK
ncbi:MULTISPECIES: MFS transporter [unclassified Pseudomonas]|uniref:MFS transporter n=1 Tax=unclassified Pseudomonas TaxID=196821 RepID=UPI000A0D86B1|nr:MULTISPECIES: MFS transporter [unclassified Pseudomonas]ATP45490.1 MFS transporter [Pseudomonas putida]MBC3488438.1 MHS family MFS transporter [Pseudomonas sp. SWRI50]SMF27657.1 Sugar phosphate permease [Pseudomonas sp. LAIL14HWK12:I11]SMR73947.1 Sugar phosphate permease [Pseudomonas sp. LAIL14HWK12:I10]SOD04062.1 Sugar phosphate permease [Pseudomonas sp. LAIL14HWK12:I8]